MPIMARMKWVLVYYREDAGDMVVSRVKDIVPISGLHHRQEVIMDGGVAFAVTMRVRAGRRTAGISGSLYVV